MHNFRLKYRQKPPSVCMQETRINLGIGLVRSPSIFNEKISNSNIIKILQEFGLSKNDFERITLGFDELCEIYRLAKSLHESVEKI